MVRWPAATIGLVLATGLLWLEQPELAYLLSAREPIALGDENGYHLERLISNRYAEIRGIPTATGAFSREGERIQVVVGVRNTPLLIRREALPTEEWVPRRPPPPPDPHPFRARGRLLAEESAPRYRAAFEMLRREAPAPDGELWIVLDGERPGADRAAALLGAGLVAFALLNLWWLARDIARRIQARRSITAAQSLR
jgi:hypothetical protein